MFVVLQSYILKCLISPDMQQLATTSSDKTVKLWNLDGFTLDRTLTGHTRWVWDCVFSVDAAYLVTASSDATARLWDLSSGEELLVVVACYIMFYALLDMLTRHTCRWEAAWEALLLLFML